MDLQKIINNKDKAADYIIREITHVIKSCGKRDPGSEGEKKSCEYMAKVLEKSAVVKMLRLRVVKLHPVRSTVGFISQLPLFCFQLRHSSLSPLFQFRLLSQAL